MVRLCPAGETLVKLLVTAKQYWRQNNSNKVLFHLRILLSAFDE